ncbi:response regulator transcription factor [Psychrilyobacter atlanticus]|uniref:response regulator transcription factor n=1 Tax=Psychrilyobacter atlanticus TaxID=271091 RepID=UPI000407CFD0|nr:response regulator transcription factor [Psychrilyobacter atlanticus]
MKILIVEDDLKLMIIVKDYLESEGFEVLEAKSYEEAMNQYYTSKNISLILLDLMLEGKKNGFDICTEIKKISEIPIVMITANSNDKDQLMGYKLGIDEYIIKPFNPQILIAKIKSILARVYGEDTFDIFDLFIDKKKQRISKGKESINLTPKEYKLFLHLVENKNKIYSREQLLNIIWGYDYYGDIRTIDTHIKSLRKKLGIDGIKTKSKVGYYLEVKNEIKK